MIILINYSNPSIDRVEAAAYIHVLSTIATVVIDENNIDINDALVHEWAVIRDNFRKRGMRYQKAREYSLRHKCRRRFKVV